MASSSPIINDVESGVVRSIIIGTTTPSPERRRNGIVGKPATAPKNGASHQRLNGVVGNDAITVFRSLETTPFLTTIRCVAGPSAALTAWQAPKWRYSGAKMASLTGVVASPPSPIAAPRMKQRLDGVALDGIAKKTLHLLH